jgi:hypothetical protein
MEMAMVCRFAAALCVCVAAATLVPAARQDQTSSPTGVIVGRVVDAQTNLPVAGVVLQLGSATSAPAAGPRPSRVVSDGQGRFLFSDLAAGNYFISASASGNGYNPNGFVVTGMGFPIGAYLEGGFGQRRPGGPLRPIALTQGQRIAGADVRMWKSSVVSGRVVDEAGEPLVHQVVGIVQLSSDGRLMNGPTMRTDDRGAYRFSGLAPGIHVVFVPQTQVSLPVSIGDELAAGPPDPTARQRFSATSAPSPSAGGIRVGTSLIATVPGGSSFPSGTPISNALAPVRRDDALFVYQTTFHPSSIRLAESARIQLGPGEERAGVDVQLHPSPATSVSGLLVDDQGGVAGMGLRLMPADHGEDASILEAAHTVSDSRGAFTFPIVPAGRYTLLALRTGRPPGVPLGATPARVSDADGAWASQQVAVGSRPVAQLRVTMQPPVSVGGRVEFSGASARPAAERLKNSFMFTIVQSKTLFRSPAPTPGSFIDPDTGRINVRGVAPPGRYFVGTPTMPAPWSLESITLAGQDVTDASFPVGNADINDLVITFTDRPAALGGTVAGGDEATVFVFPANRGRWSDVHRGTRTSRVTRPTVSGAFTLANLPPGDYLVAAIRDEDATDWPEVAFIARLAAVATPVKIAPGQQASVAVRVSVLK